LVDARPSPNDWYLNLVWIERRKCLLLTHAGTLFSAFIADVRKSDVESLQSFVTSHVHRALINEDLPPTTFGHLSAEKLELAKTVDRRVLGCMNDMAWYCTSGIEQEGGIDSCDMDEINHEVHRTFNSTTG